MSRRAAQPEEQDRLYLVSKDGEVLSREPTLPEALKRVVELEGDVKRLEADLRVKRATISKLNGALYGRAEYERAAEVQEIFGEWARVCGHERARLTNDRFDAIRSLLEVTKPEPYPRQAFSMAFAGAAFDPWTKRRKNGSVKRFDDIARHICKSGDSFEEFVKRAPTKENTHGPSA